MNIDQSLFDILTYAARHYPDRGVGILDSRGRNQIRHTFPEIEELALTTAARLASLGARPGDPVLVCLPTSWDWFGSWFGAVALGAIPVSYSPGSPLGSSHYHFQRLLEIASNFQSKLIICGERAKASLQKLPIGPIKVTSPNDLQKLAVGKMAQAYPSDSASTAYIQLTSGSTGLPRGAEISHRAAFHNMLAGADAISAPYGKSFGELYEEFVSWVPLYHDLGLINVLGNMLHGVECTLLEPWTFLGRPQIWLERMCAGRRTYCGGPNFGFQYCVDKIKDPAALGIDMSSVSPAIVSAEMVQPETLRAFLDKFQACGFPTDAFRPAYGMAEATVVITMDRLGAGLRTHAAPQTENSNIGGQEIACCGAPISDVQIRITDKQCLDLGEDKIGEIWARSPSLMSGYYRDQETTNTTLVDGWLRTGDLGFIHDGELYVTGREKDVIIIRGENYMPYDIEQIASEIAGSDGIARSAAFSVASREKGEEVILVVELIDAVASQGGELEKKVRSAVGNEIGIPVSDVVLVRRGKIPRTTSGKTKRGELRELYIQGNLDRL